MDEQQRQRKRVNDYLQNCGGTWDCFDPTPRILSSGDFTHIEKGLVQRINALNLFLNDIYENRMILRDRVIPEEFVYSSPAFPTACLGVRPVKRLYTHLSATDLLQDQDGTWYVVEDDLQTPGDCIYPHLARKLCRSEAPEPYELPTLCDNCGLDILLNQLYTDMKEGLETGSDGIVAVLDQSEGETPFAVQYLADLTGAVVAKPAELTVMEDAVYYRNPDRGGFQKVAIVHRLEPDTLLDPLCFANTTRGVPHLMEAYRRGKVAILNAPGCGAGCDRGLYYFIPDMIRYYLLEEPILPNVPTLLPWKQEDRERILDELQSQIIINVTPEGKGRVTVAGQLPPQELDRLRQAIRQSPRRYVAQTMMQPQGAQRQNDRGELFRDQEGYFRALTVCSNSVRVWMGGATRFRSAGVFQDTWVMSE